MKRSDMERALSPLKPPANFLELCDYEEGGQGAPGIDLSSDGREDIGPWAGGNERLVEALWPFAVDGTHALYAFWTHATRDLTLAPVVYLGSEGVNNNVLARNFDDFLVYLCEGFKRPGELAEE